MARWRRAQRWLPIKQGRVLDLGCAFGYATNQLARRYDAVGVEFDGDYVRRAYRRYKGAPFLRGSADAVPLKGGSFDAVLLLDVLEHVPAGHEPQVVAELQRLLRPGGWLVLSVPNAGPLAWADSLNLEMAWRRRWRRWRGRDERGLVPRHRHYALDTLRRLLVERFQVVRVTRTGLGLAEFVNLPLVALCKGLLRSDWLYEYAQYVYFTVYLIEDVLPLGPLGYHLTLLARRLDSPEAAVAASTAAALKESVELAPAPQFNTQHSSAVISPPLARLYSPFTDR